MSVPFHKQTDPSKQAGQVVLCACKDRFKHQCPGEWEQGCDLGANEKHVVVSDITLNDYIARKEEGPPRITFDEWIKEKVFTGETREYEWWRAGTSTTFCRSIWNAALTKGKL